MRPRGLDGRGRHHASDRVVVRHLPREALARLVSEFDELEFAPSQTVFSRGDPGDALYVVVDGAVEIRGEGGGAGQRLAVLGPGDCLGEMALVTGDPRSATVAALSATRLLRLDKDRFQALWRDSC